MPRSSKLDKDFRLITSKTTYRGAAPFPKPPVKGDTWEELNIEENWIESWFWDGNYWLSQKAYNNQFSTAALSTAVNSVVYPIDLESNSFITNLYAALFVNANSTATVNWGWSVARITTIGASTTLLAASNTGQAANTWRNFKIPVNVHVDIAATGAVGLRLFEIRTGTISKQGTVGFEYRKARI